MDWFKLSLSPNEVKETAAECRAKLEFNEEGRMKIGKLARDLGLKVIQNGTLKEFAPEAKQAHLTDAQTGKLFYHIAKQQGIVIYDETRTSEEKEFTIAHEIGRYMLHHWETLSALEFVIKLLKNTCSLDTEIFEHISESLRDLRGFAAEMEADLFAEHVLGRCSPDVTQIATEGTI